MQNDTLARLVSAIKSCGLSLKAFSRQSGIPYPSLVDYANGKRKPGLDAVSAIIKTSGVSADWLFTGEGSMWPEDAVPSQVDEVLFGSIARTVESTYLESTRNQPGGLMIEDAQGAGYLDTVTEHAVLAAHVYNGATHIGDEDERKQFILQKATELIDVSKMVQTAKRRFSAPEKAEPRDNSQD